MGSSLGLGIKGFCAKWAALARRARKGRAALGELGAGPGWDWVDGWTGFFPFLPSSSPPYPTQPPHLGPPSLPLPHLSRTSPSLPRPALPLPTPSLSTHIRLLHLPTHPPCPHSTHQVPGPRRLITFAHIRLTHDQDALVLGGGEGPYTWARPASGGAWGR